MSFARFLFAGGLAAMATTSPAHAVTNLILNGSFENAGKTGTNAFKNWTKANTPDNSPSEDQPASVIAYNSTASYPTSAYGEAVAPDNSASQSPDAVGNYGAYFVGDYSVNETISQLTYLGVGNYRIGFSYYLTANGLANDNNASITGTILDFTVVSTAITDASTAQVWTYASGVGQITKAGLYKTAFVFNSNGFPSKDVVIDRVFAIATNDAADVIIPETSIVPEPQTWALMIIGFGLVGVTARRRKALVAA